MSSLPPTKLIKDVLDGLLGREVDVAPADAFTPVDAVAGAMADYIDDKNKLWAVVGWDLPAAAIVGAAVGLVPRGGAEAAIEERYVPDNLIENLHEVNNVLASVFANPSNPHLRLQHTYRPINTAPNDAVQLLYALGQRIDLTVEVPGYGSGRFALSMRYGVG